jgi:hypothetical protein
MTDGVHISFDINNVQQHLLYHKSIQQERRLRVLLAAPSSRSCFPLSYYFFIYNILFMLLKRIRVLTLAMVTHILDRMSFVSKVTSCAAHAVRSPSLQRIL